MLSRSFTKTIFCLKKKTIASNHFMYKNFIIFIFIAFSLFSFRQNSSTKILISFFRFCFENHNQFFKWLLQVYLLMKFLISWVLSIFNIFKIFNRNNKSNSRMKTTRTSYFVLYFCIWCRLSLLLLILLARKRFELTEQLLP